LQRKIQKHPQWIDPRIKLAQLYCRERRNILQAFEQCLVALELKPWHIDLPQLIVELSLQRKDLGMALTWARLRLPKLYLNSTGTETARRRRRRELWVERAVSQAIQQFTVVEEERERSKRKTTGFVISEEAWPKDYR
jgi:hypothetical protein